MHGVTSSKGDRFFVFSCTSTHGIFSRVDAPPACIANASNSTNLPDLSNSTITDPTATGVPTDTTGDGSATNTDTGNSTTTDTSGGVSADNSTVTDNSNFTDPSSTRRRRELVPRIAQSDLPDLALQWQQLCLASGGDIFIENSPCVDLAGKGGLSALLVDADPCAQQDVADAMITFAKSEGVVNSDALISFALQYRRHPRNAINILGVVPSTFYCQRAPLHPELAGVSNAQLSGVNPGLFGSPNLPMVPFGANGTCPFGSTPDVSSCTCAPDSTDGTSGSLSSDGSVDNSTITDPSVTSSFDNSTITDPSATVSADDSTATDASLSTDGLSASDAATSDAPAPTDSTSTDPSITDTSAASATAVGVAPAATVSQPSDISGNVTDPSGRRR
ncbi:hypothetical protein P691DRAFT_671883 [Macrolepiota fuliginosa MF-IS2]|uniref:Uncharacterized protein n=1 Tax=Macrolepiota fuliginosa MF-IS2 TaxID=1400762 RepID=A0A9P6C320_9AGAR|nr:hypothetical protein P691DRAFT_671883 [Macrolepiota fuliginosa MF-IS2]